MGHHQTRNDFILNGARQNGHGRGGWGCGDGRLTLSAIEPTVGRGTEATPMARLTVFREMGDLRPVAIALI
jgi:hypothetical protein